MNDYNSMLMSTGGRSCKFEAIGDTVEGTIMRIDSRQRTEMGTGVPMTWKDGNPKMQLVIQLLTEQQEDDEDDGMRNLYVPIPSALQAAIAEAVRTAGQRGVGEGGVLKVQHHGTKAAEVKGYNPQKLYRARYVAPTVSVENTGGYSDEDALPF